MKQTLKLVDLRTALDGWYALQPVETITQSGDTEFYSSVVRLYTLASEHGGERGIGFNIADGGGFVALNELADAAIPALALSDLLPLVELWPTEIYQEVV